jgi:hypothetical protein
MGWAVVGSMLLAGCAPTLVQFNTRAEQVTVSKENPGPGYKEIGPISASHGEGNGVIGRKGTYEGAYTLLKNKAADTGADHVMILNIVEADSNPNDPGDNHFVIRGVAYRKSP